MVMLILLIWCCLLVSVVPSLLREAVEGIEAVRWGGVRLITLNCVLGRVTVVVAIRLGPNEGVGYALFRLGLALVLVVVIAVQVVFQALGIPPFVAMGIDELITFSAAAGAAAFSELELTTAFNIRLPIVSYLCVFLLPACI